MYQKIAFASEVPIDIYEFHLYIDNSIFPLPNSSLNSFLCLSLVKLKAFTKNLSNRLQTLYAQFYRITLAPFVLPRLLARILPELILQIISLLSLIKELYNYCCLLFIHVVSLGQTFVHCPRFCTAASRKSMTLV